MLDLSFFLVSGISDPRGDQPSTFVSCPNTTHSLAAVLPFGVSMLDSHLPWNPLNSVSLTGWGPFIFERIHSQDFGARKSKSYWYPELEENWASWSHGKCLLDPSAEQHRCPHGLSVDTEGKDLAPAQPTPSFHLWTRDSQDLLLHSEQSVFACSFPLLVLQLLSEERIIYVSTDCCSVIIFWGLLINFSLE